MVLRNLFLLSKTFIIEGKSFIVFSTFLAAFAVGTFNVQMPAVPLLESAAVEEKFLFLFFFGEGDGRRHFVR